MLRFSLATASFRVVMVLTSTVCSTTKTSHFTSTNFSLTTLNSSPKGLRNQLVFVHRCCKRRGLFKAVTVHFLVSSIFPLSTPFVLCVSFRNNNRQSPLLACHSAISVRIRTSLTLNHLLRKSNLLLTPDYCLPRSRLVSIEGHRACCKRWRTARVPTRISRPASITISISLG